MKKEQNIPFEYAPQKEYYENVEAYLKYQKNYPPESEEFQNLHHYHFYGISDGVLYDFKELTQTGKMSLFIELPFSIVGCIKLDRIKSLSQLSEEDKQKIISDALKRKELDI